MTYRDDHDAALARAAALEQQLAVARAEAADARASATVQSNQLAEVTREKMRLEAELAHERRSSGRPIDADNRSPREVVVADAKSRSVGFVAAFGLALGFVALGVFAFGRSDSDDARQIPAPRELATPTCVIASNPSGATIMLVTKGRPTALGSTPLTIRRSHLQAMPDDRVWLEATLPGYRGVAVLRYMDVQCPPTIELEKL